MTLQRRFNVTMMLLLRYVFDNVITTSILRQNDVEMSFWRNNGVIITSCVRRYSYDWANLMVADGLFPVYCQDICNHYHDDLIKRKHLPRYWPFVRAIHRWPITSPHKGQSCRVLMFSLIDARTNGWANNRTAGDLRRHRDHNDVMLWLWWQRPVAAYQDCSKGMKYYDSVP